MDPDRLAHAQQHVHPCRIVIVLRDARDTPDIDAVETYRRPEFEPSDRPADMKLKQGEPGMEMRLCQPQRRGQERHRHHQYEGTDDHVVRA